MMTAARLSAESLAALGTPPRSPRSKLDDDGTSDAEQTPDADDTELICPVCEDQERSHQVVSFRPDSLAVYQKTVEAWRLHLQGEAPVMRRHATRRDVLAVTGDCSPGASGSSQAATSGELQDVLEVQEMAVIGAF